MRAIGINQYGDTEILKLNQIIKNLMEYFL
jgi:hypothetical protein